MTTIFTARIPVETARKITETGLSAREWVEKMAKTPDFDSVYTEFGFDEVLRVMRRKGYSDGKIKDLNSQICEQILSS